MLSALLGSRHGRQFCRYSVVGFVGFVIDFGVYALLTRGFPFWRTYYIAANFVSFTCAVINNFVWHKTWTFRPESGGGEKPPRGSEDAIPAGIPVGAATACATPAVAMAVVPAPSAEHAGGLGGQFAVFVIVSIIGLGLNSLILRTVSNVATVQSLFGTRSDLFAKAVAVPIVWFWNFGANKLWTFRKG